MTFFITTSWDDGHPCDLKLARLLQKHSLAATFYVPQRSQRALLSEPELKSLANDFELGAHGIDHLPLTTLTPAEAQRQVIDSKCWIEELTAAPCTLFCPPLGQFDHRHVATFSQSGFLGYRTVELGCLCLPKKCQNIQAIPTTIQAYPHTRSALVRNALRRFKPARAFAMALPKNSCPWPEQARKWLEMTAQFGGVFHLWGHSWEIEELGWWHQLEELFKHCRNYIDQGLAISIPNSKLVKRQ